MYIAICKDGTTVKYNGGKTIEVSNGEIYTLARKVLRGSNDFRAKKVPDIVEAIDIVAGLHGGVVFSAYPQG